MATLVERRRFMQALAAASAVPAGAAAAQAPASAAEEEAPTPVTTTLHDAAGVAAPSFFDERQLAALQRLSELILPAMDGAPGALDVDAPEFLDFHVGQSPNQRRDVYRAGLDTLHALATSRFGKRFEELTDAQADQLIAEPLARPWTLSPPADPLAAFLREAKQDVLNATMNAREYVEAAGRSRRRRTASLYWYTVE